MAVATVARPRWSARIGAALLVLTSSGLVHAQERPARTPAAVFAEIVVAQRAGDGSAAAAAVEVLAASPRLDVLAILLAATDPDSPTESAAAALSVLERIGIADDAAIATSLLRVGLEEALQRTILAIARREPRTLLVLDGLVRAAPTAARVAFVRAVEELGTVDAAAWIARCAERAPDVRSEALARLGRLSESLVVPAPDEAFAVVRSMLAGVAANSALRDAVIAAGRMEDGEAVPYLIALVGDSDRGLSSDAVWALERITGLRLRDRRERWEVWYAGELAWWRDQSDRAFSSLESRDSGARSRGLLDIHGRRASRDQLAQRVVPLLDDHDPAVAKLAASTLAALRSKAGTQALLLALERPESAVADEAWRALRAITRKDLPRDPAECRAACSI